MSAEDNAGLFRTIKFDYHRLRLTLAGKVLAKAMPTVSRRGVIQDNLMESFRDENGEIHESLLRMLPLIIYIRGTKFFSYIVKVTMNILINDGIEYADLRKKYFPNAKSNIQVKFTNQDGEEFNPLG